ALRDRVAAGYVLRRGSGCGRAERRAGRQAHAKEVHARRVRHHDLDRAARARAQGDQHGQRTGRSRAAREGGHDATVGQHQPGAVVRGQRYEVRVLEVDCQVGCVGDEAHARRRVRKLEALAVDGRAGEARARRVHRYGATVRVAEGRVVGRELSRRDDAGGAGATEDVHLPTPTEPTMPTPSATARLNSPPTDAMTRAAATPTMPSNIAFGEIAGFAELTTIAIFATAPAMLVPAIDRLPWMW